MTPTDKAPKPGSDEESVETLADVIHRALVGSPIETRHLYLDDKARRMAEMVWAAGYRHESTLRASNAKLREALTHCHAFMTYDGIGKWTYMEDPRFYQDIRKAADIAAAALKETE